MHDWKLRTEWALPLFPNNNLNTPNVNKNQSKCFKATIKGNRPISDERAYKYDSVKAERPPRYRHRLGLSLSLFIPGYKYSRLVWGSDNLTNVFNWSEIKLTILNATLFSPILDLTRKLYYYSLYYYSLLSLDNTQTFTRS